MKKTFFLLIMIVIFFSGCMAGVEHCFKFDGTRGDLSGGIEYCYSKPQSDLNGTPTFESGQSKLYLVDEEFIVKANSLLQINALESSSNKDTPYQRFVKISGMK